MYRAVEEYAAEREKIAIEKAAEEMARTKAGIVNSLLEKGFTLTEAII
ncbi:hypothetical protein [Ruminococcus sp. HUN007]|nr:hypothetical protein [Ruminococcus sp. HUN007]